MTNTGNMLLGVFVEPFSIELKLEPNREGLHQLKNWPGTRFTPDFAVAASGSIRFSFNGRFVTAVNGKLTLDDSLKDETNRGSWLPDYLGGFALNLGRAASKISTGSQKSKAAFLDEPVALKFKQNPEQGLVQVELKANGQEIAEVALPASRLIAIIRLALEEFLNDLLHLNAALKNQRDVQEIERYLRDL